MQNYLQPGDHITLAASPYDVESGQGVVAGKLFGIASGDAGTGEEVVIATVGVFLLPKVATDVFAVGADVFYDDTVDAVTSTLTGHMRVGVAVKAAGSGDIHVEVRLSGAW